MSCIRISKTNKGESKLFNTLYNQVANGNEQLATIHYNYFSSKAFDKIFGFNYVDAFKKGIHNERLDENGEPLLLFDKEREKYYFLNKDNQKSYFPASSKGLTKMWTNEQIKDVVSRFVGNYIKNHLNMNFNNIDFSESNPLPKLDQFITLEIDEKIASLMTIIESGDESLIDEAYGRLTFLKESLNHIEELKDLVNQKFKSIAIDIIEEEDDFEDEVQVNDREGVIGKVSMARSSKASVTTNVKLRLSLLEDTENVDAIWGEPKLLDFDTVYGKLQEILSNNIPLENEFLFETFKTKVIENSKYFPYLSKLSELLINNEDENFQYEFTQAFYQAKNSFVNESYKNNEEGYVQETIDLSNKSDKKTVVKAFFIDKFNSLFTNKDENGLRRVKETEKENLKTIIKNLKEKFNEKAVASQSSKTNLREVNAYKKYVHDILSSLGIEVSEKAFDFYLKYPIIKNIENYTKEEQSEILLKIHNNITNLVAKLDGYILKGVLNNINKDIDINQIFNTSDEINKLVNAEAFFIKKNMSENMTRIGGEKRYVFSNPSHLHMELEKWKKDPSILLKSYENDVYEGSSRWIEQWFEMDTPMTRKERIEVGSKNLEKVKLGVLGEITMNKGGKDEVTKTTDLGFKDYFINNINSVLKNQGFTRTITQADKSTEFTFKTLVKRLKGLVGYNKILDEYEISDEVNKTYFNYYLSELRRATVAKNVVEEAIKNNDYSQLTPHYHYNYKEFLKNPESIKNFNGNAFKSQYFDKLNVKTDSPKSSIEKEIVDLVYNKNGTLKITNVSKLFVSELEDKFNEYLQTMITFETKNQLKEMLSLGIIKVENGRYVNKLLDAELVDDYALSKTPDGIHTAITKIAMNYMINGISNNIEFTKLFTGDIAYYKDSVDFKKRVPATYTDGTYLILRPGEEYFNIATIQAVMQDSPFLKALKEDNEKNGIDDHTIKMLSNINSTDAQAWITPQRWKFLKKRLGEWSKSHDEIYRKMLSDENEEYSKEELKIAAQPLKGVYFYKINGKPTYLKYSQAVLSKSMIKSTDLERVYDKMVDPKYKIDELITFDGVKVGSITPTKIHDDLGNVLPDEKLQFNVQQLSNHGWKLQQNLPTKNFKNTDVGSQIMKNIYAGIRHYYENSNFEFRGKKISGEELHNILVETIGNLTDEGYKRLISKAGIDKNGKITDTRKFYKSLITELKSRGGSENVIKALEAETSLFGIPQTTGKLFQIFASMINKNIVKIQTNGGSFIQMADFGLSLNSIKKGKTGIVLNPGIDGLRPPMITTNEDGTKTVTPAGVFVPASFIAKYIPDWKNYSPEELFVSYKGGYPIIDKRIQENIIGYRIPNQGLPSNDAFMIAGILPESAGDTIVAYVGITSKTGSDYDIDKMYLMFPHYDKVVDKNQEVFEQVEKVLRGLTNRETLSNYKNFLNKFKELDNSKLSKDFVSEYEKITDKEKQTLFLREIRKELIKVIVNNSESNIVKNNFKDLKFKTTGLKYVTKDTKGEQNKLIEIYKSVLTNPDVYTNLMKSIDNDFIKDEINSIQFEENNSFMKAMNPRDDIKTRYDYLGGKAGVGMEANAMTDIWRSGKLYITNLANFTWGNYNNVTKETELDMEYSEELSDEDLDYYVSEMIKEDASKEKVEEFKKFIKKVKIGETLGTILNAFVDIAKDPYISKGNWSTSTTNTGNLMLRMGVHPLYVLSFIGNPIISEYNQFQQNNEGLFDNQSGDIFEKFIEFKQFDSQEFKKLNIFDRQTEQHSFKKLNLESFRNAIKNKKSNSSELGLSLEKELLSEFRNIQNVSKNLKRIVDFGKSDVNGLGKDPHSVFQLEELLGEILLNEDKLTDKENKQDKGIIRGFRSKLDNTILAKIYNNLLNVKNILEQNPTMFPMANENVRGMLGLMVNDITKNYSKKEEIYGKLSQEFKTYIFSKVFDIQKEDRIKLEKNMPSYFNNYAFKNKGKYFMIDNLSVITDKNGDETLGINNSDKSLEFQRSFTDSWEDLFEEDPKFAEALVKYSFITSGFNSTRSQFYSYIPYQYFINININKKVNDIFNNVNFEEFENKFYLNNLPNTTFVKNVLAKDTITVDKFSITTEKNKGQFIFTNGTYYKLVGKDLNDQFMYVEIENKNVSNDYSVELKLKDYNNSMLKSEINIDNQESFVSLKPEIQQKTELSQKEYNNLSEESKTVTKSDLLKSLFTKDTFSNVVKGSVVNYNDKKWIVWNISDSNKAQLINTEGEKFSGTPNLDKLTKIGDYTTTVFNGIDYIVTQNENIYSLATGKQVYTNLDNSTKTQKAKIIEQIMKENDLLLDTSNLTELEIKTIKDQQENC